MRLRCAGSVRPVSPTRWDRNMTRSLQKNDEHSRQGHAAGSRGSTAGARRFTAPDDEQAFIPLQPALLACHARSSQHFNPGMKIDFTSWNFNRKQGTSAIPFFENSFRITKYYSQVIENKENNLSYMSYIRHGCSAANRSIILLCTSHRLPRTVAIDAATGHPTFLFFCLLITRRSICPSTRTISKPSPV